MGIRAAIYGPGLGGLLGGSDYNILGPAGALVNILKVYSGNYGVEIVPWLAFLSGLMALLVYLTKLEKYCTIIPNSVLEGFSFSVALVIGLGQLRNAFGIGQTIKDAIAAGDEKATSVFYELVVQSVKFVPQLAVKDFAPFLVFFITLFSLMKFLPGKPWIVPVALVGTIYGVIMNAVGGAARPVLLRDEFPSMKTSTSLVDFGTWGSYKFAVFGVAPIVVGAFKVAFVAVLETLISARIADNKTGTRFVQDKEVFGLSIANMVSGIMGGTPCTGVLVRTAVNIASGADHKYSQFINAVWVLVFAIVLIPYFSYIPMAIIASMLITSACRLIPFDIMASMWKHDKAEFFILWFTGIVCIFVDGAMGLMAGCFISLLRHAVNSGLAEIDIKDSANELRIVPDGPINFINTIDFGVKTVDAVKATSASKIVVDLTTVTHIDCDGLENLERIVAVAKDTKVEFVP